MTSETSAVHETFTKIQADVKSTITKIDACMDELSTHGNALDKLAKDVASTGNETLAKALNDAADQYWDAYNYIENEVGANSDDIEEILLVTLKKE